MISLFLLTENYDILRELRSLLQSQYKLKNCIFVRTAIIVAVLIKTQKQCNFVRTGRNPNKENCDHDDYSPIKT